MTFTVQSRKQSATCRPTRCANNAGFTLVEILLALGLSVALMVAVYSALDLYRHFTTVGRDEMKQSQLARSLLRKMEADIRSSMFQPPKKNATSISTRSSSENSNSSSNSSSSSSDNSTSAPSDDQSHIIDPIDALSGEKTGIFGDAETLVLHVNRPSRPLLLTAETTDDILPGHESDLRSIAYFLATPGAAGLQGLVGDDGSGGSGEKAAGGFARLEGDRLRITLADETTDMETLSSQTEILAREINFLGFRYYTKGFDGLEWLESWNSTSDGGLPLAIEITLGFGSPEEQESTKQSDDQSSKIYRLVVSLPLSGESASPSF